MQLESHPCKLHLSIFQVISKIGLQPQAGLQELVSKASTLFVKSKNRVSKVDIFLMFKTTSCDLPILAPYRENMFIPAAIVNTLTSNLSHSEKMTFFLSLLNEIEKWSLCAISNFQVGILGIDDQNNCYFGVNAEFPNTPIHTTIHSEQFLVSNVFKHGISTSLEHLFLKAAPCGHCRQFLSETVGSNTMITVFHDEIHETRELKNLLPFSFGPMDLGVNQSLLQQERDYEKKITKSQLEQATIWANENAIRQMAVEAAATKAFAPFSGVHEGCVLVCENGEICVGSSIESAAFNPSLMSVQVAIIDVYRKGIALDSIVSATIVSMRPSVGKGPNFEKFGKMLLVSAGCMKEEDIEFVTF